MYYEINVAKREDDGKYRHFFATHKRSITCTAQALLMAKEFVALYPDPEYYVTIYYHPEVSYGIDINDFINDEGFGEDRDEEVHAMIKLAYFTANFPPDFINKCFGDEGTMMVEHISLKLRSTDGHCTSMGDFMRFFMELDSSHKEKLCAWIMNNYR